jgi:hypothetical protein
MKAARPHLREKIIFATEEIDFLDEDVINIKTDIGSWSSRLRAILNHPLLYDYEDILYLQEDFILRDIKWDIVDWCYETHIREETDIFKFGTQHEFNTETIGVMCGMPLRLQKRHDTYSISHQPVALMNKYFLLKTLDGDFGPSEHEINGSQKYDAKVFCLGNVSNPNRSEVIDYVHAIQRGQVIESAKPYLRSLGWTE